MEQRELRFARIDRALEWLFVLLGAALIAWHARRGDWFNFAISLGVPAVPLLLRGIYRLLGWRQVRQIDFWVLLFVLLSYPLGCCAGGYRLVPGFDKLAHMLSGGFVGLLSLAVYYWLKPGHAVEERDCALALTFLFFGSMAVAGLWELVEFMINAVSGIDVQRVQTTGVRDTMQDMTVCMLGTIAVMPAARAMCRGRRNPLADSVRAFIAINCK